MTRVLPLQNIEKFVESPLFGAVSLDIYIKGRLNKLSEKSELFVESPFFLDTHYGEVVKAASVVKKVDMQNISLRKEFAKDWIGLGYILQLTRSYRDRCPKAVIGLVKEGY